MDTPIHAALERKYRRRARWTRILHRLLPGWRVDEVTALGAVTVLVALFLAFVAVTS